MLHFLLISVIKGENNGELLSSNPSKTSREADEPVWEEIFLLAVLFPPVLHLFGRNGPNPPVSPPVLSTFIRKELIIPAQNYPRGAYNPYVTGNNGDKCAKSHSAQQSHLSARLFPTLR